MEEIVNTRIFIEAALIVSLQTVINTTTVSQGPTYFEKILRAIKYISLCPLFNFIRTSLPSNTFVDMKILNRKRNNRVRAAHFLSDTTRVLQGSFMCLSDRQEQDKQKQSDWWSVEDWWVSVWWLKLIWAHSSEGLRCWARRKRRRDSQSELSGLRVSPVSRWVLSFQSASWCDCWMLTWSQQTASWCSCSSSPAVCRLGEGQWKWHPLWIRWLVHAALANVSMCSPPGVHSWPGWLQSVLSLKETLWQPDTLNRSDWVYWELWPIRGQREFRRNCGPIRGQSNECNNCEALRDSYDPDLWRFLLLTEGWRSIYIWSLETGNIMPPLHCSAWRLSVSVMRGDKQQLSVCVCVCDLHMMDHLKQRWRLTQFVSEHMRWWRGAALLVWDDKEQQHCWYDMMKRSSTVD